MSTIKITFCLELINGREVIEVHEDELLNNLTICPYQEDLTSSEGFIIIEETSKRDTLEIGDFLHFLMQHFFLEPIIKLMGEGESSYTCTLFSGGADIVFESVISKGVTHIHIFEPIPSYSKREPSVDTYYPRDELFIAFYNCVQRYIKVLEKRKIKLGVSLSPPGTVTFAEKARKALEKHNLL